jgi:hypothetical protein
MDAANSIKVRRGWLAMLTTAAILMSAGAAIAQETEPGDTCSGFATGSFRQSAGDGTIGHILICDGTNWQPLFSHNSDGEATTIGNQSCGNGDVLTFNSSIWTCGSGLGSSLWTEGVGTIYYNSGTPLVGIGNSGPTVALDVTGSSKISSTLTVGGGTPASGYTAALGVTGSTVIAGNLQLGNGNVGSIGRSISFTGTGWTDPSIRTSGSSYDFSLYTGRSTDNNNQNLHFYMGSPNNATGRIEAMTFIGNTGNIGIGDTTPDEHEDSDGDDYLKLDVEGYIGGEKYCDEDGNDCFTAADASGLFNGSSGLWRASGGDVIYYSSGAPKVGIGTASPSRTLHVAGGVEIDYTAPGYGLHIGAVSLTISGGGNDTLVINRPTIIPIIKHPNQSGSTLTWSGNGESSLIFTGNDGFKIKEHGSSQTDGQATLDIQGEAGQTDNLTEWQASDGSTLSMVDKDGQLGIGVTPDVALDVAGDIEYTGFIADVSDSRLKTNIQSLSPERGDAIGALQPVSFEMKDREGLRELGFIAQDVEQVFPELVQTSESGTKSMNYIGLIAPMVKAIQQLQADNEALKAEVDAMTCEKQGTKAAEQPAAPHGLND